MKYIISGEKYTFCIYKVLQSIALYLVRPVRQCPVSIPSDPVDTKHESCTRYCFVRGTVSHVHVKTYMYVLLRRARIICVCVRTNTFVAISCTHKKSGSIFAVLANNLYVCRHTQRGRMKE